MPLKLRKRKNSPNWYIRGTVRGQPVDESTGTADRATAEAIRIKREGETLERSVFGAAATATFLEAVVGYLQGGGDPRFLGQWNEGLGRWTGVTGQLAATKLSAIGQAEIERVARILYPLASPATRNRQAITPIAAVLHHAAERGLCAWRRVRRLDEARPRFTWLRPAEADRLIACCSPHLAPLVTFLLYTGARLSEAIDLDWREVDLAGRRVAFLDTKNGTDRGVPLCQRAVVALGNLGYREGRVFRRPDGQPYADKERLEGGQIKTAWATACRRAGLAVPVLDKHGKPKMTRHKEPRPVMRPTVTPHDCRHTWATWLFAESRDLRLLMELGGWRTMQMVTRYAHVNPDHLRPAIDLLPGAGSGKNPGSDLPTRGKTSA